MLWLLKVAMDTAICMVVASGKPKDWLVWMEKFSAKEKHMNLKHIYLMDLSKKKIPIPAQFENLDPTKPNDKFLIYLAKAKEDAYSELIMAIDMNTMAGMIAFRIIMSTKTMEYPDGNAPISWKRLKMKYQSNTDVELMWITKELYKMDIKEGQDPKIFITKLEYNWSRKEKLGSKITDIQFKMRIFNNLPAEYDVAVNLLTRKILVVTLEELRADLQYEYNQLKARNNSGNNNNNNDNRR
jgi:gag-polypeptide of LTR copia-type